MQPVTINHVKYLIPLSWDECSFRQAVGVVKNVNDKGKQLTALTGIPEYVVNGLTDFQASQFFTLIAFTENLEVFESADVKDEHKDFDFNVIPFGKAEYCRKALHEADSGFEGVILCMQKLLNIEVGKEPFLEWIGTANFFLSKLLSSLLVIPNLAKVDQALNKSKLVTEDYIILGALQQQWKSQEVEPSDQQ